MHIHTQATHSNRCSPKVAVFPQAHFCIFIFVWYYEMTSCLCVMLSLSHIKYPSHYAPYYTSYMFPKKMFCVTTKVPSFCSADSPKLCVCFTTTRESVLMAASDYIWSVHSPFGGMSFIVAGRSKSFTFSSVILIGSHCFLLSPGTPAFSNSYNYNRFFSSVSTPPVAYFSSLGRPPCPLGFDWESASGFSYHMVKGTDWINTALSCWPSPPQNTQTHTHTYACTFH